MTLKLAKPTGAAIKIAKPTGAMLSITPSNLLVDDADALAYLTAVETTDGQALESGMRLAVNAFVKGCKADGIWPALKASCILAGARTRLGALTPLVGTAPTSFNFVDADYNRKTGLVGAVGKSLDSNRNNNADPQDSNHNAIFLGANVGLIGSLYLGAGRGSSGGNLLQRQSGPTLRTQNRCSAEASTGLSTGFIGISRNSSTRYQRRVSSATTTITQDSQTPFNGNITLFNDTIGGTILFYSIGEALNLALLDARVTTLINAIGAAIP